MTAPLRVKVADRPKVLSIRLRVDDKLDLRALVRCQNVGSVCLDVGDEGRLAAVFECLADLPHLVKLRLHYVRDALPREIGLLRGLRSFEMPGDWSLGRGPERLPDELWMLDRLEELDLSGGRLREIPDGIGALSSLRKLDLGGNRALSRLPATMGNLGSLLHLDLQMPNELTAEHAFAVFSELPKLRLLRICSDAIRTLPPVLGTFGALEWLDVGRRLSTLPEGIGQLRLLRALKLGWNHLEMIPDAIAHLPRLEVLELEKNDSLDLSRAIEVVARSRSLRSLQLSARGQVAGAEIKAAHDGASLAATRHEVALARGLGR